MFDLSFTSEEFRALFYATGSNIVILLSGILGAVLLILSAVISAELYKRLTRLFGIVALLMSPAVTCFFTNGTERGK